MGRVLFVVFLAAAAIGGEPQRSAELSSSARAVLDSDYQIVVVVEPHAGDAWTRLAKRVTGDGSRWKELAEFNGMGETLTTHLPVRIPFAMLRPELQRQSVRALFPDDVETPGGWTHKVIVGGTVEGESLWMIAEWFTGDGANYAEIRKANPSQSLSTRPGDLILIPRSVLSEAFTSKSTAPLIAEDDPQGGLESRVAGLESAEFRRETADPRPETSLLEYQRGGDRPYAIYRLRRDEAIYSSVVIRFTGRVFVKDVSDAVEQVIAFNDIRDVARLPVGYPVRIPMELLAPEHRPLDDPRRIKYERAKLEATRLARRVKARNLEGVHVIIDPGHGGRDVGTVHKGLWESTYVYDVACRLKKALETRTAAKVHMTTRSRENGYQVLDRNELPKTSDHVVLTSPKYLLENPVVGVNLRWYLANSIFRKALRTAVPAEKVIFISIHADSVHPSLRGAMAYVPGNRYVQGSYTKNQQVYLARAEVRENPTVTQSEEEALRAEGFSTELAKSIIAAFQESDLDVHPFSPVRDNVVREGREWVPAIIRYNKVPTRLLLEICNIANEEDRKVVKTRKHRQKVATAIYAGIVDYFVNQADVPGVVAASK